MLTIIKMDDLKEIVNVCRAKIDIKGFDYHWDHGTHEMIEFMIAIHNIENPENQLDPSQEFLTIGI